MAEIARVRVSSSKEEKGKENAERVWKDEGDLANIEGSLAARWEVCQITQSDWD